jgi:hypothetical protein
VWRLQAFGVPRLGQAGTERPDSVAKGCKRCVAEILAKYHRRWKTAKTNDTLARQRLRQVCDRAGKKTAGVAVARALAAEGRTAQADAEASTPLPWAQGTETEALSGCEWLMRREFSLQLALPNVRRKGRPACGTSP